MPCSDSLYNDVEAYRAEDAKKINQLTKMLCWLCSNVTPSVLNANIPLLQWWTDHQENDRARELKESESLRMQADQLLTESLRLRKEADKRVKHWTNAAMPH